MKSQFTQNLWAKILLNSNYTVPHTQTFELHDKDKALKIAEYGKRLIEEVNNKTKE